MERSLPSTRPTADRRVIPAGHQQRRPAESAVHPASTIQHVHAQQVIPLLAELDQPLPAPALEPIPDRQLPREIPIPLMGQPVPGQVDLSVNRDRISLIAREAPINVVLGLIAQENDLNIVTAENVNGTVSVTLREVTLAAALNAILRVNGYAWTRQDDIIVVTRLTAESSAPPATQGRQLRVFTLNFLSAVEVDAVVKGLLSPVGKSFVNETNPLDKRRTREQLIVEDLPEYLERIEQYLCQADHPPQQVLIEAHILQIDLKDDCKHGVDIQNLLARIDNTRVTLKTVGFTNPDASPAFFLGVDGTDLDVLVEALQTTTDSKTLAAPKVLVVNGQEARIQIGAKLGFLVTTTTQTSTLQDVQFLDVGVVLRVTPQITQDGRVLMTVKPQVSTGEINVLTGLPQEETTEVETTVMLADGRGMIIGGLIQEADTIHQNKIPLIGDLWLVGRLFQKKVVSRSRSEIVIALVPRLVPYTIDYSAQEDARLLRATSPLLGPQLERIDRRPVEPELPDAVRNPRSWELRRIPHFFHNLWQLYPHPASYYFPSADGDSDLHGFYTRDRQIQGGHATAPGGGLYGVPSPVFVPPLPVDGGMP